MLDGKVIGDCHQKLSRIIRIHSAKIGESI